jgi:hypothetical protein
MSEPYQEWKETIKRTTEVWVKLREPCKYSNDLLYGAGVVDWSLQKSPDCQTKIRITIEEIVEGEDNECYPQNIPQEKWRG